MLKIKTFLLLVLLLACGFGMTALGACGDDDDRSVVNGVGEVCVVAMLPENLAAYASLEVTYYDALGRARFFTVREGESSDDIPEYARTALNTLELFNGFTIVNGKNIIRSVRFAVPTGTKVSAKYKVLMNGTSPKKYPSKVYSPFAVVTGKRANGEILLVRGTTRISQKVIGGLDVFKSWLEEIRDKEKETYVQMN